MFAVVKAKIFEKEQKFQKMLAPQEITVKHLVTKARKIYITAQPSGYNVSALTTVSYLKQNNFLTKSALAKC